MYTIIRDTKEKKGHGWIFREGGDFDGMEYSGLKTGDYTIKGYEDILAIERKGTLDEFAGNLTQKRFDRELKRLEKIKYAFVILEFDMDDIFRWPASSSVVECICCKCNSKFYKSRKSFDNSKYNSNPLCYSCLGKMLGKFIRIPKFINSRLSAKQILAMFLKLQTQYSCHFLFAGNHGQDVAYSIFKRVIELENVKSKNRKRKTNET